MNVMNGEIFIKPIYRSNDKIFIKVETDLFSIKLTEFRNQILSSEYFEIIQSEILSGNWSNRICEIYIKK